MNATELLAMYERVADAPDAMGQLRSFVLDLAVRGKLVEQDEKAVSSSWGSPSRAPELNPDEFPVPGHWRWTTVGDAADSRLGKMLDKSKNKGTPRRYLRNVNVRWFDFDLSDLAEMRFEDAELPEFELRVGDVLICEGGEPGRAAVWDARAQDLYFQKAIHRVRFLGEVAPTFFVLSLRASANDGRLAKYFTGTGIKHFTGKGLASYRFPLPPIAEQQHIVAKVAELMALCDQLEAARTEREAARDRLAAASLTRLNAPDPDTFQADARFALNVLPALSARPDQVNQLRQTILNLAVRGKLSMRGHCWDSPRSLGEVATLQNGYAFKSEWFTRRGVRLLRNVNVSHGVLSWKDDVCLPSDRSEEYSRFLLGEGDVVLSLDRPFITTGTKAARVRAGDLPALLLQRVGRFQPTEALLADFLYLWLVSPHFSEQVDPGRSNGVPHISSRQVEAALIFVPPIAEQQRIVEVVNELTALCDQLEASLANGEGARSRLLEAVLHRAIYSV